uniref:Hemolymph juvenile hormone binding protein n=1 Tax=Heliothis virescens TaxID=7102 RepID=A0A2A4JEF6_HELVI
MKTIVAFAVLIVGISASALSGLNSDSGLERSARFVTDTIVSEIENVSQQIKDAGLDPLHIKKENFDFALPVPVIFNANAVVEDILSTGLSDIVINNINFSLLASRLDLEIELPYIHAFARVVNADATLFGNTLSVRGDGRLDIRNLVVKVEVRVSIGIISGISISSVIVDLGIPTVSTNIRLAIQGNNYSEQINELIGKTIPDTLNEFNDEINELLGIVLKDMINDQL